jgi:hypothetical protein
MQCLCVGGPGSSTVNVTASPPAVRIGPELAFQLHQAPDLGAVGADVGLDVGGRLADGYQVDAEQLGALLQRRRDRPAQVWVVPGPHRSRVSNRRSEPNRESCLARWLDGLRACASRRGGTRQARAVMITKLSHQVIIWRSRACDPILHPGTPVGPVHRAAAHSPGPPPPAAWQTEAQDAVQVVLAATPRASVALLATIRCMGTELWRSESASGGRGPLPLSPAVWPFVQVQADHQLPRAGSTLTGPDAL